MDFFYLGFVFSNADVLTESSSVSWTAKQQIVDFFLFLIRICTLVLCTFAYHLIVQPNQSNHSNISMHLNLLAMLFFRWCDAISMLFPVNVHDGNWWFLKTCQFCQLMLAFLGWNFNENCTQPALSKTSVDNPEICISLSVLFAHNEIFDWFHRYEFRCSQASSVPERKYVWHQSRVLHSQVYHVDIKNVLVIL